MNVHRLLVASLATIPFAAWAMPLVAPWGLLLPLVTAGLASILAIREGYAVITIIVAAASFLAMLLGFLPLPFGTSLLALAALLPVGRGALAVGAAGMALHTSAAATVDASVASWLASVSLEAASPALVGAAVLAAATWRQPILAMLSVLLTLAFAWVAEIIGLLPHEAMALASSPLIAMVILATVRMRPGSFGAALIVCVLALATWLATPPKTLGELYVVLPQSTDVYEATFFDHYIEALTIAGIEAEATLDISSIPSAATVLLPWTSAPLPGNANGEDGAAKLGALARERGWTVIVAGEHDGYGDVDLRAEEMAGRPLFARDLTVPPGNRDASGPLRAAGLVPWRHDAILNRGASVTPPAVSGRVLLSGDGWWTEPHLGEWLWTGDYVWRADDRGGRITLAAAYKDGAALWVAVGDSSPFINQQIIADPRPVRALLSMASLYPALMADIFALAAAGFALGAGWGGRSRIAIWAAWTLVGMAAAVCLIVFATAPRPSSLQMGIMLGESGFDERNFNVALAEEPRLALSDWSLRRKGAPISGKVNWGDGREVVFAHVNDEAFFGAARLSNCWRLGSLQVDDGPYLMDAQACRLEGEAEVLVGSRDAAAIVAFGKGKYRRILVLDTAFLAARAPGANRDWLLAAMTGQE